MFDIFGVFLLFFWSFAVLWSCLCGLIVSELLILHRFIERIACLTGPPFREPVLPDVN